VKERLFLSFSTVQLCVLQRQGGTHTLPSQSKGYNVNGHIHGGGNSVRTFPRVQQSRLDRRLIRFQKFNRARKRPQSRDERQRPIYTVMEPSLHAKQDPLHVRYANS